jgi:hypothetical protein
MSDISPELIAQFDQARAAGQALAETEPRAVRAWYAADSERVFMELTNGVIMGFPYQLLQGLEHGTPVFALGKFRCRSGYITIGVGIIWF